MDLVIEHSCALCGGSVEPCPHGDGLYVCANEPISDHHGEHVDVLPGEAIVYFDDDGKPKVDMATCGHCGRTWNDALGTSITPAPSARCPFEYEHVYEDDEEDDEEVVAEAHGFRVTITRSAGKDKAVVILVDGPDEGPTRQRDELPDGSPRCRILLNDEPVYKSVEYEHVPEED